MDERIKDDTDTPALVKKGVELFAQIETAMASAMDGLVALSGIYPAGYANGAIKGGEALKARDECLSLAGDLASLHSAVVDLHERSTVFAQEAGADIAAPYAELPPKKGPTPKSGGR